MQELTKNKHILSNQKRAQLIQQLKKNSSSIQSISRRNIEFAPLSYAQEPLWIASQMEPNGSVYNVSWALKLHGLVNRDALQQSLNEVVRRHEYCEAAL